MVTLLSFSLDNIIAERASTALLWSNIRVLLCNSWTISSKELGPNVKVFCVSICVSNFIVYLFSHANPRGSSCLEISIGIAPIIILERFIELISDVKERLVIMILFGDFIIFNRG